MNTRVCRNTRPHYKRSCICKWPGGQSDAWNSSESGDFQKVSLVFSWIIIIQFFIRPSGQLSTQCETIKPPAWQVDMITLFIKKLRPFLHVLS